MLSVFVYTCRRLIDLSLIVYTCRRLIDLSNDCRKHEETEQKKATKRAGQLFALQMMNSVFKMMKFAEVDREIRSAVAIRKLDSEALHGEQGVISRLYKPSPMSQRRNGMF